MLRLALLLLTLTLPATAQESVVTGLSTDNIALTANFDGSEIFIFGAIRRDAPSPPGTPPPGVIITLKGPERAITVRRKDRRFGIWLNTESLRIRDAPSFYAIATTDPLDEMLSETERLRYQIGMDLALRRVEGNPKLDNTSGFTQAVVRIRTESGLYAQDNGGVSLAEETLFQTRVDMPANLVEGDYATEFFLVRGREVISTGTTIVRVEKAGVERWLYNLAQQRPLIYGMVAVLLALAAGWLANTAFRLAKR